MKKYFLVVLMALVVSVAMVPRPAHALGLDSVAGALVSKDSKITDNGGFVVKAKGELVYDDTHQSVLGYGDFSRVNPVPIAPFTDLRISIHPIGAIEINKKTGMPKATLVASWDDQPFHELNRTPDGGWEVIIPLGGREPGTLTFTAQVTGVTGKERSNVRVLFIKLPFFSHKSDISKVVANSIDFECFDYTSDRSDDSKSIALWVKDMINLTTTEFAGTMPRYDMKLGSLPSDNVSAKQTGPVNTSSVQPAPIVKAFELLPGTGSYDGKVILRAVQDVSNAELQLISGNQVIETQSIACQAGKKFAINPNGLTDIRIGSQSWSLREQ